MLKIQVIGYIGQDARVTINEGGSVANFSVAHTEKFKNSTGVSQEKTTWIECSIWDRPKLHEFLKKGQQVYLEGIPGVKQYENKEGKIVSGLRMNVFNIQLLGGSKSSVGEQQDQTSNSESSDDLPF